MLVFTYDGSFEGLLSVIFEAFSLRQDPALILGRGETPPLLADRVVEVATDPAKAGRVWSGLEKKLSPTALRQLMYAWLTGEAGSAELVLRYVRAVYAGAAESDFGQPDVLALWQTARKVSREREHLRQFLRFQKTAGGVFFAAVAPPYNVLPLCRSHFVRRFADQRWLIWDLVRQYGFYYDLKEAREVDSLEPIGGAALEPALGRAEVDPQSGRLAGEFLAEDESLLQEAWRTYFKSVAIAERANPKLQRQFMPRRFWAYLTEMQ